MLRIPVNYDIYRFHHQLRLTRCWQVALSPYTLTRDGYECGLPTHFMIRIFENRISNKPVTFLLDAAELLQWECVWSPGDVSLVIVNLSPLFSAGCCEGNQRACAEVVRSPTIPSNKPLWDLHEHCCKYSQAVCRMRELATFRVGVLNKASVNIHGIYNNDLILLLALWQVIAQRSRVTIRCHNQLWVSLVA